MVWKDTNLVFIIESSSMWRVKKGKRNNKTFYVLLEE